MTLRSAAAALLTAVTMTTTVQGQTQTPASGTKPAPAPCAAPEFRQFDFWAGSWEVTDAQGKPAGRNRISREQLDCVLIEHWQSESGGTGMSMNYYDPAAQRWTQHWVGFGTILTMTGGLRGESMILEGPLQYIGQRRTTILRGTWTPLPDGRVRQHFVESSDGGKTWTEWFDGYYRRAEL